jgi:hypothetical protein
MLDVLAQAASPGTPATPDADEDLAGAAAEPSFQKMIELLKELDAAPKPWKKCPGVFRCGKLAATRLRKHFASQAQLGERLKAAPARERAALLLDRLQAHVRAAGFQLVGLNIEATSFLLFPTADKYAVLRACGTDGSNYGHSTEDIIAWLEEMEKQNPFVLTTCSHDCVIGKFAGPLENAGALAERMCRFCPDLIDGDIIASPSQVAAELQQTQQFCLWWG